MKWSRTFLICTTLAVVLFVPAAWLVIAGLRLRRAFEHEQVAPLAEVAADLSMPNVVEFPVHVTYPSGHGFKVLVKGPPTTPGTFDMEPWLQDLKGTITIVSGPYSLENPVELGPLHSFASGFDSCAVARVSNSPPGDYVLRLIISNGATALKGTPHKVVVMNDVCGCELLGVFWGNLIAVALTIFGLASLGGAFSAQCTVDGKNRDIG